MIVCMRLCVRLGNTYSALLLAGPRDTELQKPLLCWTIRFWVTPNTEFVLFILTSEFVQSYFLCMASLRTVDVLQKGAKHEISAQNHFQKRRKKLFRNLKAMGFLPIFLWQRKRIGSPC